MTELEQLKTLLANIETLISQYKTSIATPVVQEDLSTHINKWLSTNVTPNKDKTLISGYVHPFKWTRNVNCWSKNIDLSGLSVCILGLGGVGGGTLITRKHVLLSNHVPYPALPVTIYFVDNNNNYSEYKITKTKRVPNTDILIGELDREVDQSLKVYNVLPSTYKNYFKGTPSLPVIYSDQEKKTLIGDFNSECLFDGEQTIQITQSVDSTRSLYFESLAVGDSGNPIFTVINNEPVLIGGWYRTWYNSAGLGTNIPNYIKDINSIIASLSPGYKLSEANLAGFKTYN